jgi:hypothetical protein
MNRISPLISRLARSFPNASQDFKCKNRSPRRAKVFFLNQRHFREYPRKCTNQTVVSLRNKVYGQQKITLIILTKRIQVVCSLAWNPAGVALGQKKTLARRGRCLDMLEGTPDRAEIDRVPKYSAAFGLRA